MKHTRFFLFLVAILLVFSSCKYEGLQSVTPNPKIRPIPGGIEITPQLSGKDQVKKIKSVRLAVTPVGESMAKPMEREILIDQPYRLSFPGTFSYTLTYVGENYKTLGISNQTIAASDSMTWDVVVSLALPSQSIDRCNCNVANSSTLIYDAAIPNERSLTWGPSTATNQDIRRITITNPLSGESVTSIVSMKTDGTLNLITRSGDIQPCLTEGGFSFSSDNRSVIYSASSLFFSIKSQYVVTGVMSIGQKMTITCPAAYTVTVEKLSCP